MDHYAGTSVEVMAISIIIHIKRDGIFHTDFFMEYSDCMKYFVRFLY